MDDRRRVYLAVDNPEGEVQALALIKSVMKGPMEPYIAGVKLNDALHMRDGEGGPDLVQTIESFSQVPPFVDLKSADIAQTVLNTIGRYCAVTPGILATVSVHCSAMTFWKLQTELPKLRVAAMGVPTDISVDDCEERYGAKPAACMHIWYEALCNQYARIVEKEGKGGEFPSEFAIGSVDMLPMYKEFFPHLRVLLPGVRDIWMLKQGQKRTTGTVDALEAGAYYLVMGNQLYTGNPDAGISPEESQARTAAELEIYFANAA